MRRKAQQQTPCTKQLPGQAPSEMTESPSSELVRPGQVPLIHAVDCQRVAAYKSTKSSKTQLKAPVRHQWMLNVPRNQCQPCPPLQRTEDLCQLVRTQRRNPQYGSRKQPTSKATDSVHGPVGFDGPHTLYHTLSLPHSN